MPRIAITHNDPSKTEPYAQAIRNAGAEPVLVCPAGAVTSLDGFGGLLLTGGTDLNPKLYGEPLNPQTDHPDDARDSLELSLLREALDRDLPVLAICRGMQLFNVAHPGGTLRQHIEGHAIRTPDKSLPAHIVKVCPQTALAAIVGAPQLRVNSRHHQAVSDVGQHLAVSAIAPDGVIEALERPGKRFAIAVQWHPENQWRFPTHRRLLRAFAGACAR